MATDEQIAEWYIKAAIIDAEARTIYRNTWTVHDMLTALRALVADMFPYVPQGELTPGQQEVVADEFQKQTKITAEELSRLVAGRQPEHVLEVQDSEIQSESQFKPTPVPPIQPV